MLIKVKTLQCLIANEVTGLEEKEKNLWIAILTSVLLALKNKFILIPHPQPTWDTQIAQRKDPLPTVLPENLSLSACLLATLFQGNRWPRHQTQSGISRYKYKSGISRNHPFYPSLENERELEVLVIKCAGDRCRAAGHIFEHIILGLILIFIEFIYLPIL